MTNNEQSSAPAALEAAPKSKSANKNCGGIALSAFGIVCSVLALALAFYVYIIQNKQQSVIDQELDNSSMIYKTVEDIVKRHNDSEHNNNKTLQADIDQIKKHQAEIDSELASLNKGLIKAYKQQNQSPEDWVLYEVEHLVRIADLNLQYIRNIPATISILQNAEQRIQAIGDPNLQSLRQLVADAIMELKVVPNVDLPKLMTQIQALDKLVARFPFSATNVLANEKTIADEPADKSKHSKWKMAWQASLNKLSKVVVVRKHEENVQPIIYPEHQTLIKENLHLMLQQLQWAALQNNQELFHKNIQQARSIIEKYAKPSDPISQEFLVNFKELEKLDLRPQIPDISNLQKAVQMQIKQRHADQQAELNKMHHDVPRRAA